MRSRTLLVVAIAAATVVGGLGGAGFAVPADGGPAPRPAGSAGPPSPCAGADHTHAYNVTALRVPIVYNNWGDFDPEGRLFVLDENRVELVTQAIRRVEEANLDPLAEPLRELRDAFRDGAPEDALEANRDLDAAIEATLEDPGDLEPGRLRPIELAQPFVVRAHPGDCVRFNLLNAIPEDVGLRVEGLETRAGQGTALGENAPDLTGPAERRDYVARIPDVAAMEGAHFLRSHADPHYQTKHGLWGSLTVEPDGARWLDPANNTRARESGTTAIVDLPSGQSDYREFHQFYHDTVELWNSRTLEALPIIDEFNVYGPGSKAINMRSEPFMHRFQHHDRLEEEGVVERGHDKSQGYGSYTYGDPAISIPESYVGEPTKFRLVNVGPGQNHVHHLHGGGIRWRATPVGADTQFDDGFIKKGNEHVRSQSERKDVQNIAPGESYNIEPEGGAGGVQQTVGDLLFHCHIVEHYLAGMWSFWRVYDTRQPGLDPLPDRAAAPQAVNSTELLGRTLPDGTELTEDNVDEWVEIQLPAQGVPEPGDASVWDWRVEDTPWGPLYLGEPETNVTWPNYPADDPERVPAGERPELLFNPENGKLAYPVLRPHFGQRPPFAPGHGPTAYLNETVSETDPHGLCPTDAPRRDYDLVALSTEAPYNKFDRDPNGQVYVRAQDKAEILAGERDPKSLAVRANQYDCVDVTLTSQLDENPAEDLERGIASKVNIHIHLVQFDIQASDGVIVGRNFEQSVRSAAGATQTGFEGAAATTTTASGAPATGGGQTTIPVANLGPFLDATGEPKLGSQVGVGLTEPDLEQARLAAVDPASGTITLDRELGEDHEAGEIVGYEFVNYRWYPDVELGMVYWHDHVDALNSWQHGLFGGLVVEPNGSRWLDPEREVADPAQNPDRPTDHTVDVVTPDDAANETKTFRELVVQIQDRGCFRASSGCTAATSFPQPPKRQLEPASFNLRSEPLYRRNAQPLASSGTYEDSPLTDVDESQFSQGDPATDTLQAYPGDETMIRVLYAGQTTSTGVGTFSVTGHRFPLEQYNPGSEVVDTQSVGISSQFNFRLACGAGGCAEQPGDYVYSMGDPDKIDRGAWGLLRVHDPAEGRPIQELASNPDPEAGALPDGPTRAYDVVATETPLTLQGFLTGETQRRVFVPADRADEVEAGAVAPEPLVLRSKPGEVVEVRLENRLDEPVSFHAGLVSGAPEDLGIPAGTNGDARTQPGETQTYRFHAGEELGVARVSSLGDTDRPGAQERAGLYGALVVEPPDSTWEDDVGPSTNVTLADGTPVREHVLLFHSQDPQFQTSTMPYRPTPSGPLSINYASAPWENRTGRTTVTSCETDQDFCGTDRGVRFEQRNPLNPWATFGPDPRTPVLEAEEGQPAVVRAVGAAGNQVQTLAIGGHWWAEDWAMDDCRLDHAGCGSRLVANAPLGPGEVANAWLPEAGPAGEGDYLYGTHRDPFLEAGGWGILRVR